MTKGHIPWIQPWIRWHIMFSYSVKGSLCKQGSFHTSNTPCHQEAWAADTWLASAVTLLPPQCIQVATWCGRNSHFDCEEDSPKLPNITTFSLASRFAFPLIDFPLLINAICLYREGHGCHQDGALKLNNYLGASAHIQAYLCTHRHRTIGIRSWQGTAIKQW